MLAVVGVVLIAAFLPSLARSYGKDPGLAFSLAVLNPLVLLFLVGSGHNDALMIGLLVAGLSIARRGHPGWGMVLCALAGAIKIPGAIGVFAIAWMAVKGSRPLWRRALALAVAAAVTVAVLEALTLAFGVGWGWIKSLGASETVTTWITPSDLLAKVVPHLGVPASTFLMFAHLVGYSIAAVICVWALRHLPTIGLPRALGVILLAIVILGPIVQPWYLLWGLVPLAVTAGVRTASAIALVSVSATLAGAIGLGQLTSEFSSLGSLYELLLLLTVAATIVAPTGPGLRRGAALTRVRTSPGSVVTADAPVPAGLIARGNFVMSGTRELARSPTARNVIMWDSADDGGSCDEDETATVGRNWKVILGIAATALLVLTLQYLWHRHFSAVDEYDDGVYFGASVNSDMAYGPTGISPLSSRP